MADLPVTLLLISAVAAAAVALLRRFRPGPELAGVSVGVGEWGALSFRLPRRRAYRVWARVSIDGEDRNDVKAELEVKADASVLCAPLPVTVSAARWYDSASCFTLELCRLPALPPGTMVAVRGRVIGVSGTPLKEARIYVG